MYDYQLLLMKNYHQDAHVRAPGHFNLHTF